MFRMLMFAVVGLAFVGLLGWITNWPFALYCYSILIAGVAAQQAISAGPRHVPLWMSSAGGKLFLSLVGFFAAVSPFLLGIILFRWWWGLAGYVLGGLGAALSGPVPWILRLYLVCFCALGRLRVYWHDRTLKQRKGGRACTRCTWTSRCAATG